MKELFEAGKVVPVIDGPYKLSELPEAMRYFGEGRHKGKVLLVTESGGRELSAPVKGLKS
jgi:NADPH:quinone reductase-like Zn-dependent oxidoreductase